MPQDDVLRLIDQAAKENWKELDLSGYDLTELPPDIGKLTQLESLVLTKEVDNTYMGNQLTSLPAEIGLLKHLRTLQVSGNWRYQLRDVFLTATAKPGNQLNALPPEIGQLTSLQQLYLSFNQLSALPPEIGQLTSLQQLYLSFNQLSALPPEIVQLTRLQQLVLSDNPLSALPPEIVQLTSLQRLYLSYNQLSALPPEIVQLTRLQQLDLSDNQLSALPPEIVQLNHLVQLDLRGNPIPIPPEILGPRERYRNPGDKQAILDYYFQTLDPNQTDPLYEAKFVIVGEGGAGKTTLAQKLLDPDYELDPDEPSTEGIDVLRWEFEQSHGMPFRINMWDFGGQEIYHATHQFFLTKRSLYVLVIDTRQDNTDLYYWLKVIELLSDNSPVFIIKNEKQDRQCDVNERQLRGEFINLEQVFTTNLADNRGLDAIKTAIQQRIVQLPHVGTPLPKVWVRVRAALENYAATQNYITTEAYWELCRTCQLTDQQRMTNLGSYLHDLGVILHFQEDPILRRYVILKPEWGTAAVYKALDNPEVRNNMGRFSRQHLDTIWNDNEYSNMRDELLQLMMRFKLCYPIPGTTDDYIAPQLLDIEQPCYDWDTTNTLLLRYDYDFMPKGILTRFIVEMHKFIEDQSLVWKSGVVLTNGSARAEVIEFYHKGEIHIRVSGPRPKDLLTVITHEIDQINESYERIRVNTLIPCNCTECKVSGLPEFFSLKDLHRFLDKRQDQIQCRRSFAMVNVRPLIDGVSDRIAFENYSSDPSWNDGGIVGKTRRTAATVDPEERMASWPIQTLNTQNPIQQRLQLVKTLNKLSGAQFKSLVFALGVPPSNLGGDAAPQANQVASLLEWVNSELGCGLETLAHTLEELLKN